MRLLFASCAALCALATCMCIAVAPHDRDSFFEHAKQTKIADYFYDDVLKKISDSAFAYVVNTVLPPSEQARAIALVDNIEPENLRCRHDAPWMYGILETVTMTDVDPSLNLNFMDAFKLFDAKCINTSIFADGATPLDAVISNISHLDLNNTKNLIALFQTSEAMEAHAPIITFKLIEKIFSKGGEQEQLDQKAVKAYLFWVQHSGASEKIAQINMTRSAAVNPALVFHLGSLSQFGTSVLFTNNPSESVNSAYKDSFDLQFLTYVAYSRLNTKAQTFVKNSFSMLGITRFEQPNGVLGLRDIKSLEQKSTKNIINPTHYITEDKGISFLNEIFTVLLDFDQINIKSEFSAIRSSALPYWHNGQLSLKEYVLLLAAQEPVSPPSEDGTSGKTSSVDVTQELSGSAFLDRVAKFNTIIDLFKIDVSNIHSAGWSALLQSPNLKYLKAYLSKRSLSHRAEMSASSLSSSGGASAAKLAHINMEYSDMVTSFQLAFPSYHDRFARIDGDGQAFRRMLNEAQCVIRSEALLPAYANNTISHCLLPSDKTSVVERMKEYYSKIRNPLWVLVPSSHGHWPDAFWLHDMGCFFPWLGVRLALYYAGGISVLAALVLLLVRCCNRRIDKTKARYALPRPVDE